MRRYIGVVLVGTAVASAYARPEPPWFWCLVIGGCVSFGLLILKDAP